MTQNQERALEIMGMATEYNLSLDAVITVSDGNLRFSDEECIELDNHSPYSWVDIKKAFNRRV